MSVSEEDERLLRVSLERSEGNARKLQKPSIELYNEGVALSKLQSQWILFSSFALIAFFVSHLNDEFAKNSIASVIGMIAFASLSIVLSWLSLLKWADHFFNKSTWYAEFFSHEMRITRIWFENLKKGQNAKQERYENSSLANQFKKDQDLAIIFKNLAAASFCLSLLFVAIPTIANL